MLECLSLSCRGLSYSNESYLGGPASDRNGRPCGRARRGLQGKRDRLSASRPISVTRHKGLPVFSMNLPVWAQSKEHGSGLGSAPDQYKVRRNVSMQSGWCGRVETSARRLDGYLSGMGAWRGGEARGQSGRRCRGHLYTANHMPGSVNLMPLFEPLDMAASVFVWELGHLPSWV
jgi:hypothetical protein